MSEPVVEPQEPAVEPEPVPTEPQEPVDPQEPTEVPEPGEEPAEPQEPTQEPVDPSEPDVEMRSEKELERAHKQIDKLREHVANRVGSILGEDSNLLIPCPACGDEIPGFVWPPEAAPVPPDKVGALSAYIGLPDLTKLQDAKDATQCADCMGLGEVRTHSRVPGYTTKTCSRCVGKGYTGTGHIVMPETGVGNGTTPQPPLYEPPAETANPPEVEALRRQGYLVVAPSQPIAAG